MSDKQAKGRRQLVEALTARTALSRSEAGRLMAAFVEVMQDSLAQGKTVRLSGFGTLKVVETAARQGCHPQTGQPLPIPAGRRVHFRPSRNLTQISPESIDSGSH